MADHVHPEPVCGFGPMPHDPSCVKMDGRMIACGISDRPDWPYAGALCRHKDKPFFNPAKWNAALAEQIANNCYNYATCQQNGTFAQPGVGGCGHPARGLTCPDFTAAAKADGLRPCDDCDDDCPKRCWKVALVIDPRPGRDGDFHWYREDEDGTWSHKPGALPATNRDASGDTIDDPRTADRDYSGSGGQNYTVFCGCFCVCPPVSVASLDGSRSGEFAMAETGVTITLLQFSGLPNASWTLTRAQTGELARRLRGLRETKPVPVKWSGIAIGNAGRVRGIPESALLHDRVIEMDVEGQRKAFRDPGVGKWLTSLNPSGETRPSRKG